MVSIDILARHKLEPKLYKSNTASGSFQVIELEFASEDMASGRVQLTSTDIFLFLNLKAFFLRPL